jgi:LCP family protein required for cell wall assembly
MKKILGNERWKKAAWAILTVQLIIEAITMYIIIWLDILPLAYAVAAGIVLVLALIAEFFLFFPRKKGEDDKDRKTALYVRRTVGCLLSVSMMALCILASYMMAKAGLLMQEISRTVVTDTVSAYVLKDDPAETLEDAKDYVFAITDHYDYAHTQTMIEQINEATGTQIKTKTYSDMFSMTQALYEGEVGAMILNAAYVDVIESVDEYENFSQETRTLFDHDIESVATDNTPTETKHGITVDPFVVYVSGSDTRNFKLATSRSDVNILVVVNPTTKQVLLINTPRDYYVEISIGNGSRDKLTHCGIYGVDCSMDTLGNLYDEKVDYYAQINFNGFTKLVDSVGGITIESDKAFYCSEGGYYIAKGTNELNGTVALSYVRERKSFLDGDNTRGRNQMQAIQAIIEKISSGKTILTNYSDILDSMEGMFSTNLTSAQMSSLVKMQLSDMATWNVKSFAVTGEGSSQTTYSMPTQRTYVMLPNEEEIAYAKLLVDKVMDGGTLTDADMEMPTTQSSSESESSE